MISVAEFSVGSTCPRLRGRATAFAIEQPADIDLGAIVVRPTAQIDSPDPDCDERSEQMITDVGEIVVRPAAQS